ncbi:MAG TPA: hypothetical protein VG713_21230, partial [Pirellulales bacterium]|nr:hypothetical protein [Pirellulales bacterium]
MTACCWTIDQSQARLTFGPLTARVELAAPRPALADVVYRGRAIAAARLLGVELGSAALAPDDCYARGDDLVATYSPRADHRVQVYWRCRRVPDQPEAVVV